VRTPASRREVLLGFHTVAEVLGFIATLITIGQFAWQAHQWRKRSGMRIRTDEASPRDTLGGPGRTDDLPARTVPGRAQLRRFLASYPVLVRLKAVAPQILVWVSVAYVVLFIVFRPSTSARVFREIGAALLDLRILIPLGIVVCGAFALARIDEWRLPVELRRLARWLRRRVSTGEPLATLSAIIRLAGLVLLVLLLLIRPGSVVVIVGGVWEGVSAIFGGIADFFANLA